jgi:hypothetical protein
MMPEMYHKLSVRKAESSESILGMDKRDSFFTYYGRFLGRLLRDGYEWPRDNILFAFFMVVAPAVAAWLRDPTHVPDWVVMKTTGWFYVALFVVYAIYHAIRTPWKLDIDRSRELAAVATSRDDLARELKEIEDARPNIVFREPGARHIQVVTFYGGGGTIILPFVKVRFINQQREGGSVAEAKGIRAKIEFFNESAQSLLRMDGRWDTSKHPSKLGPGESFNDLLRMDFGVEEEQNVDVAFWDQNAGQFVAFNNDSYQIPNFTKPGHLLGEGPITALIRLVGSQFDRTFHLRFGLERQKYTWLIKSQQGRG